MTILPRIYAGFRSAIYIGPSLKLEPHANIAITVAVALGKPFIISVADDSDNLMEAVEKYFYIIPSSKRHHLICDDNLLFIYLDPTYINFSSITNRDPALIANYISAEKNICPNKILRTAGITIKTTTDKKISQVINLLRSNPIHFSNSREAAESVHLSESRFRERFIRETGISFGQYRIWRRMNKAIQLISEGKSLTYSATTSGFSSSAHFSSSFKKMFGISARNLISKGLKISIFEEN